MCVYIYIYIYVYIVRAVLVLQAEGPIWLGPEGVFKLHLLNVATY